MQNLDTIGALFANSWKRFEERFAVAVAIFAVPAVLIVLSRLLLIEKTPAAYLFGALIYAVSGVISIIAAYAMISAFGKNTDFAASYQTGIKLFWPAIWISILLCLAVLGGFIMLIIPGIILMVQLGLANYALVIDGKHGMAALKQSRAYIKGQWWAIVGRMLLLVLIFLVAAIVILAPLSILLGPIAGVIFYGAFILFVTPFAVAYQYEIFHNLRRLKPDVAELAAKDDSSFVKVSMVVGVIGAILFPILIVAGFVGFSWFSGMHSGYSNGYQQQYPLTTGGTGDQSAISPTSGPVGTSVTISGLDMNAVGPTETVLMDSLVAERDVPVSSGGELIFTVPASLGPNCDPTHACPQFLMQTSPKTYTVSIEQNAEDPNPISVGSFTVVGNSIGTVNPGGPIQPVQPLE